jgi:CobW/HypB/UreG family nucleotide-binding protein
VTVPRFVRTYFKQLMKSGSASLSLLEAARRDAERMICCTLREDLLVEISKLAREGRFAYLLVESTGLSERLPVAEPRLGRRTVLTFPLLPPPQKN